MTAWNTNLEECPFDTCVFLTVEIKYGNCANIPHVVIDNRHQRNGFSISDGYNILAWKLIEFPQPY